MPPGEEQLARENKYAKSWRRATSPASARSPANPMGAVEPIDYALVAERNKKEVDTTYQKSRSCQVCRKRQTGSAMPTRRRGCACRMHLRPLRVKPAAKLASQGKASSKMISILWPLDDARYIAEVSSPTTLAGIQTSRSVRRRRRSRIRPAYGKASNSFAAEYWADKHHRSKLVRLPSSKARKS